MTLEQEEMLCRLICKLESTDYSDLESLAKDAYNQALADAVEFLQEYPEHSVESVLNLKIID